MGASYLYQPLVVPNGEKACVQGSHPHGPFLELQREAHFLHTQLLPQDMESPVRKKMLTFSKGFAL